ncbi:YadA-like family protein, partial [Histophilus somni]|uniref:YadA-like family protein n=1 Tax=Histophilus somni TaxID=731 RepID=UPI00201EB990
LEQAANALPDGKAKAQIEAQLKETQEELAKAQKALETAKTDLQTAQESLTKANNAYEANYDGYAKVADLVSADSTAVLSNVATIADVQAVAKSGMKFKGNDGVEVRKQLSETLSITGEGTFNSDLTAAGNIKVEMSQDGKGLEVKLSDKLQNMTSFETREVNGRKSTLNSNGLSVVDQDSEAVVTAQGTRIAGKGNHAGQSASYTLDGVAITGKNGSVQLNTTALSFATTRDQAGRPVGTGVIQGLKDLDAHATGDMAVNKNYVDARNHELRTQMNNNDRNMRAGVAQAVAQANLPINILPGKSTLSLATGNYMGTQAFAVGYSRVSDNGKLSVKFSLGHGDKKTSVGAGVGYSW